MRKYLRTISSYKNLPCSPPRPKIGRFQTRHPLWLVVERHRQRQHSAWPRPPPKKTENFLHQSTVVGIFQPQLEKKTKKNIPTKWWWVYWWWIPWVPRIRKKSPKKQKKSISPFVFLPSPYWPNISAEMDHHGVISLYKYAWNHHSFSRHARYCATKSRGWFSRKK